METSPGFALQLGLAVSPTLSLVGGLRYIRATFAENEGVPDDFEITHR